MKMGFEDSNMKPLTNKRLKDPLRDVINNEMRHDTF
jgi:hypothetical protein